MDPPANNKPSPWYSRVKVLLVLLIVFLIIAGGIIYWYLSGLGYVSTDDAYIDAERLTISSQIQERINCLCFEEGDSVSTGDTLIILNDSLLIAQLTAAQAAVEAARQDSGRAAVVLNGARLDLARGRYQYQHGIVPKQTFDHLQQAAQKAELEFQASIAEINSALARYNAAVTNLNYTTIIAKSSGRIARRWVAKGDIALPGQSLYTVFQTGEPWVTVNFEETKIGPVKPGDSTDIHVDAFGKRTFKGAVLWTGAATASEFSLLPPSNASGNFTKVTQRVPCRISIKEIYNNTSESPARLVPGMSVEVKVKVNK